MKLFITKRLLISTIAAFAVLSSAAKEYHVAKNGSDTNSGTVSHPLLNINTAAQKALPGDTITVHEGIYREYVDPLRGGRTENTRILYRAAEGENVEIKGSEIVKGWKKVKGSNGKIWTVSLPNSMFGSFNPFSETLIGDWVEPPYTLHLADVFINEVSMYEAESVDSLLKVRTNHRDPDGVVMNWFSTVGENETTITASFGNLDPNIESIEISVRPTCFYPSREGINFITVRGFKMSQTATKWAAPTAEQIGIIAPHWCKGWIIEDNVIKNSKSSGIAIGKEAGSGDNVWTYDKRVDDGHLHFIECIFRAIQHSWKKESVGSHIIRNNIISDCGQAGICGALGCIFSEIYGNTIYNICCKEEFGGAEQSGIKLHCGIDVNIYGNIIYNSTRGIWMDWMGQGARISSNICYDNFAVDLFLERNHGPFVVDNNICLSGAALVDDSEGGAYIHNLFGGDIGHYGGYRYIPYMLNHSTTIKGVSAFVQSDNRFIDNIVICKPSKKNQLVEYYKQDSIKPIMKGNITVNDKDAAITTFYSSFRTINGSELGTPVLTDYPYENPDGTNEFVGSKSQMPLSDCNYSAG